MVSFPSRKHATSPPGGDSGLEEPLPDPPAKPKFTLFEHLRPLLRSRLRWVLLIPGVIATVLAWRVGSFLQALLLELGSALMLIAAVEVLIEADAKRQRAEDTWERKALAWRILVREVRRALAVPIHSWNRIGHGTGVGDRDALWDRLGYHFRNAAEASYTAVPMGIDQLPSRDTNTPGDRWSASSIRRSPPPASRLVPRAKRSAIPVRRPHPQIYPT